MSRTGAMLEAARVFEAQPTNVLGLTSDEQDALIVSLARVDERWVVISHYRDVEWLLTGQPTNVSSRQRILNFALVPRQYRSLMKAVIYRYLKHGREGKVRPRGSTIVALLHEALLFLRFLVRVGIENLSEVTTMNCAAYAAECKAYRRGSTQKLLAPETLARRFAAVEALHELSQYTHDPMTIHPWPDTSSHQMAGLTESDYDAASRPRRTLLIPDAVFVAMFQFAWAIILHSEVVLDLRDALYQVAVERKSQSRPTITLQRNQLLKRRGWPGGLSTFNEALHDLRTACYIVVASLCGCRNHEIVFMRSDTCYQTENDEGEKFWWMRSRSTKTDEAKPEWMIPEAAVRALKVMERWATPYQERIDAEIAVRRATNARDPEIATAERHRDALFLGVSGGRSTLLRTLTSGQMNTCLRKFAEKRGLIWPFASHQFRRKFANYAARSQFGDLRYLREHFKHWSLDMTLSYALNETQEIQIYSEIRTSSTISRKVSRPRGSNLVSRSPATTGRISRHGVIALR